MNYYKIAGVILKSSFRLPAFEGFSFAGGTADMELTETDELPAPGEVQNIGEIVCRRLPDGWFFQSACTDRKGLYVSADYSQLRILGADGPVLTNEPEEFVRIALECMLARKGFVVLHSAAVELRGEAYAFTGCSGIGKSTRAKAWTEALGAKLISGDRPLIDVSQMKLYGVPWDGKEQCFRNVCYPLKAILEVRRSESTYVRAMTFIQRKKLLLSQCFLPMWDTETAVIQMANINRLAAEAEIVRSFCGPSGENARELYDAVCRNHILMEKPDMKAKPGFVIRNIAEEKMLMPADNNIGQFNGVLLLNDVSALVWQKLQDPVSSDDLLKAVLDEFEVEKTVAEDDLDNLLRTLKEYDVIED